MKKIYLTLLLGFLFMSSQAQWYEYTGTKHINYFNGSQTEKTDVFHWEADTWAGGTSFTQSNGELTIENGVTKSRNVNYYLDSTNIDISAMPYLLIEAKADTTFTENIFVADGGGGATGFALTIDLTPTYKTFVLGLSGVGSLNVTNVTRIKFNNTGTTISAANDNFYIKHLALGDTTQTITLIDDNKLEDESLVCYPNPVINQLNVSGVEGISEATITDLTGKVLMVVDAADVADGIDVADLTTGMYILSIETAKGTLDELFIKE